MKSLPRSVLAGWVRCTATKDAKLKREVAKKMLPDSFAGGPGCMTRFQCQAEMLAAWNHPNIAQIYGIASP